MTKPTISMYFFFGAAACVGVTALAAQSSHAAAQANAGQGNSQTRACMVKTFENGAEFPIVLPASNVDAMEAKGFEVAPCGKSFRGRPSIENWRDEICRIASLQSEGMQDQYEEKWGERPAVLCAMAELTSSRWTRGRSR